MSSENCKQAQVIVATICDFLLWISIIALLYMSCGGTPQNRCIENGKQWIGGDCIDSNTPAADN